MLKTVNLIILGIPISFLGHSLWPYGYYPQRFLGGVDSSKVFWVLHSLINSNQILNYVYGNVFKIFRSSTLWVFQRLNSPMYIVKLYKCYVGTIWAPIIYGHTNKAKYHLHPFHVKSDILTRSIQGHLEDNILSQLLQLLVW